MQEVLVFAGTSEGRNLARQLAQNEIPVTVCVATEYGRAVLEEETDSRIQVRMGRLTKTQMEELLLSKSWWAVVDATHPFAVEVSKNIAQACEKQEKKYLRLLREDDSFGRTSKYREGTVVYVESVLEAVKYLNQSQGNILLTTGSKDLPLYVQGIQDISRLYVRILPNGPEVENCHNLGLKGRQIICMQGPFSTALNVALLEEFQVSVLVTKETASAGGFPQKLEAAAQTGVQTIVIRRPKEEGVSLEEILGYFGVKKEKSIGQRKITLAGIGMGALSSMTREVYEECQKADLIFGAARMLDTIKELAKPMQNLYQSQEILDYVETHPQYQNIVVLLSGDVGFYSGAKKLQETLEGVYSLRILCGVPSVVYFASRLKMAWEDLPLLSLHGRKQNVIGVLDHYGKAFVLTDGAQGIRNLSQELLEYGFSQASMYVGYQLSYPQEEIIQGKPKDFLEYDRQGPSSVILLKGQRQERIVTHGIPDREFIRGKTPMTKEEVRCISLSKLELSANAVIYDIGAGTGSIAVECARQSITGSVYAIEQNEQALELLKENQRKHRAWNLEIVAGQAPEALEGLPVPTHAFIGGSGGRLLEIVEVLWRKNPSVRLVINVISLETLREVMELMDDEIFSHKDIVQISVAKARELGRHPLMMGQNPVYVITLQK